MCAEDNGAGTGKHYQIEVQHLSPHVRVSQVKVEEGEERDCAALKRSKGTVRLQPRAFLALVLEE